MIDRELEQSRLKLNASLSNSLADTPYDIMKMPATEFLLKCAQDELFNDKFNVELSVPNELDLLSLGNALAMASGPPQAQRQERFVE